MKEVMQEYGSSILTVIIALILFSLIFGKLQVDGDKGFMEIVEAKTHISQKNFSEYKDSEETKRAMERKRPVITYKNVTLQAGEKVSVEDCFFAEDIDGNPAKIQWVKVENLIGEEVKIQDGKIQFTGQGIYRVWVKATDLNCGVTESVFEIPVMHG